MTTDPRVIECAKALALNHYAKRFELPIDAPEVVRHAMADLDSYISAARACILKWLEQEPTREMLTSEVRAVDNDEYIGVTEKCATELYTAMNAQAAKEISE